MIDHLRGRLAGGGKDFVVLECAGIGFRARVSDATRRDLPPDASDALAMAFCRAVTRDLDPKGNRG